MLTAKQLLNELQKERNDKKGLKVFVVVDGVSFPALGFERDEINNAVKIIADTSAVADKTEQSKP